MIQYWGYPFENHVVTTRDGYILNLHRIPHGANEKSEDAKSVQRPVVFLGHALECSSSEYAFGPANKSLAYILADAGIRFIEFSHLLENVNSYLFQMTYIDLNVYNVIKAI